MVEWATRFCRRNVFFRKQAYRCSEACAAYSLRNFSSQYCSWPKIHFVMDEQLLYMYWWFSKESWGSGNCPISKKRSPRKKVEFAVLASAFVLSNRTVRWIFREDLHFYPHKMDITRKLSQQDWRNRLQAYETSIHTLPRDAAVFFGDEAYFHISGSANKQNVDYWSSESHGESMTNPWEASTQWLSDGLARSRH